MRNASPLPELLVIILIVIMYGVIYSQMNPSAFGFKSKIDPFYFSITTMSTTGYGDYSPKTTNAKIVVMSQMLFMIAGAAAVIGQFMKLKNTIRQ
jgi:hypothetical protein